MDLNINFQELERININSNNLSNLLNLISNFKIKK